MQEITNYIAAKSAKEREKKSMRTSIIVHAIILILAMLPFLSMKPDPAWQTIMVTFEEEPIDVSSGSSNEGAKKSSSSSAAASDVVDDIVQEAPQEEVIVQEEAVIEEVASQEIAEVAPLETPPILTSPSDAPSMPKVKEVNVKIPVSTPDPVPVKTESKKINQQVKKTDAPIKKINVTKPASEPVKVPTKSSSSGSKTSSTSPSSGTGKSDKNNTDGTGAGSSDSGDGETDGAGDGPGKQGDGDDFFGSGFGSGSGDGIFDGDGILTRTIVKQPSLSHLISESGTFAVNVCVNRKGKVTFLEYNEKHSTIKDKALRREALSAASEYLFESKASAPNRECGIVKIKIKIRR